MAPAKRSTAKRSTAKRTTAKRTTAKRKPRTVSESKPSRAAALEDIVLKLARGETSAAKDAAEVYVADGS